MDTIIFTSIYFLKREGLFTFEEKLLFYGESPVDCLKHVCACVFRTPVKNAHISYYYEYLTILSAW